jgi:hypothetical protein
LGAEYQELTHAIAGEDAAAVSAAAVAIDAELRVAVAELPKTRDEMSLALLEETRALRAGMADLAQSQFVGNPLFFLLPNLL